MFSRFFYLPLFFIILVPQLIYSQDLPPIKLEFSTVVYSMDYKVIGYIGPKHRVDIKDLKNICGYVPSCLIATEDRDFYNHDGVSYKGIVRGLLSTITGNTQGGSTLTMQLARNLYLTFEQTITRKLTEIDIARKLEKKFSKNQILVLYLNTVNFGNGAYGIWAASQLYFNKPPRDLSLLESATLVGILQNPTIFNPIKHYDNALNRRNEVLHNLVEVGKLSEKEYNRLKKQSLGLNVNDGVGRFFKEYVRREAESILSKKGININKDQLKIYTTLDYEVQRAAEDAVESQWYNASGKLKEAEIGLISIEPGTGYIRAMIGGNEQSSSVGINRTTQIQRQPGSSFKPFLYGSMLEKGYTLAEPLLDSVLVLNAGTAYEWRPQNSDNEYTGKYIPLEDAVQHSVNLAAAYSIKTFSNPDTVISFANRLGINSKLSPVYSIALGTSDVKPIEMAAAYGVFASGGIYAKPFAITKIEDKWGTVVYSKSIDSMRVLDDGTSYLVTNALEKVVKGGTAESVNRYYNGPAAGKTGTTQNSTDTWFVGYTPKLSTAIWIGYDNPKYKLTGGFQYGGTAAAPIWGKMMNKVPRTFKPNYEKPEQIVEADLCLESGQLASNKCKNHKIFLVNKDKMPDNCYIHDPTEKYDIHNGF